MKLVSILNALNNANIKPIHIDEARNAHPGIIHITGHVKISFDVNENFAQVKVYAVNKLRISNKIRNIKILMKHLNVALEYEKLFLK